MGFECFRAGGDKNTVLRSHPLESDSLVNDQILREIATSPMRDASFTDLDIQSLDFIFY